MGQSLDAVIEMQVDDDVLVDRQPRRAAEAAAAGKPVKRAPTTTRKACKIRLMAYYKQTSPLIGYYYAKGLLKASMASARSTRWPLKSRCSGLG
jgi:adenylate kinase